MREPLDLEFVEYVFNKMDLASLAPCLLDIIAFSATYLGTQSQIFLKSFNFYMERLKKGELYNGLAFKEFYEQIYKQKALNQIWK